MFILFSFLMTGDCEWQGVLNITIHWPYTINSISISPSFFSTHTPTNKPNKNRLIDPDQSNSYQFNSKSFFDFKLIIIILHYYHIVMDLIWKEWLSGLNVQYFIIYWCIIMVNDPILSHIQHWIYILLFLALYIESLYRDTRCAYARKIL